MQFSRTELLIGDAALARLSRAHAAVFGLGGVGSYAAEALVRSGVGELTIVDNDIVCLSNLNRQLPALHSTIGQAKTDAMAARLMDVNPGLRLNVRHTFFNRDTADGFDFTAFDYVLDAIDTVSSKLLLVERAHAAGTPIVCCMGAGNKLDPTRFEAADISETSVCPLARVMRRELRSRGIERLTVVYSKEQPLKPINPPPPEPGSSRRQTPGSVSFVPPVAGMICASVIVRALIDQ